MTYFLKERLTSGPTRPGAYNILLTELTYCFDHAPRGAALEVLQKIGVRTGTSFSRYLQTFRVVVASTVEKSGPLASSPDMMIELARIGMAQQYQMLMPTLFPGKMATRERPYDSLQSMWTALANLNVVQHPPVKVTPLLPPLRPHLSVLKL